MSNIPQHTKHLSDVLEALNRSGMELHFSARGITKDMLVSEGDEVHQIECELEQRGVIFCGIDEVGRGPLYGPVVAVALVLPKDYALEGIGDSKKLSAKKREVLAKRLMADCAYGVGKVEAEMIDEVNILVATKMAMRQAVDALNRGLAERGQGEVEVALIDALILDDMRCEQLAVVKGDAVSRAVGAASIVAKVIRDGIMDEDGARHPEYGLERHKGYGTKQHTDAILKYGLLPGHRRSFLKKLLAEDTWK